MKPEVYVVSDYKTLFHGTTESGLNRIKLGLCKGASPWKISNSSKMYFVDLDSPESYKSINISEELAIKKAFDQAALQSCMNEDTNLYVLECSIFKGFVENDTSFDGAEDVQVDVDKFNYRSVYKIHKLTVNKYCKPTILLGMWENGQCNRFDIPDDLYEYVQNVFFSRTDKTRFEIEKEISGKDSWKTK